MNKEIMNILGKLDKGKITPESAAEFIRKSDLRSSMPKKGSSKIKVIVISKEEGRTIKLPAIPFWLITSLGNLAMKLAPLGLQYSKNLSTKDKHYLSNLQCLDLKEIFNVLKNHEPCDLVHIIDEDQDGSQVKITIL